MSAFFNVLATLFAIFVVFFGGIALGTLLVAQFFKNSEDNWYL